MALMLMFIAVGRVWLVDQKREVADRRKSRVGRGDAAAMFNMRLTSTYNSQHE